MNRVLPILFNTDMVRAILDGRKKTTRRIAKGVYPYSEYGGFTTRIKGEWTGLISMENIIKLKAPCHSGDILYVRETWNFAYDTDDCDHIIENTGRYIYYADDPMPFSYWIDSDTGEYKEQMPWKPSIHMPKEAARIWLKVTDVKLEQLQEIDYKGAYDEGAGLKNTLYLIGERVCEFAKIWDSTIKKKDLPVYGWKANPWVWVIEFERCNKPEGID